MCSIYSNSYIIKPGFCSQIIYDIYRWCFCVFVFLYFSRLSIAERTEDASKAIAAKRELRARVEEISKDYDEEKKLTFDITQDMTRQYKGMQEELLNRVSMLFYMLFYIRYIYIYIHSFYCNCLICWLVLTCNNL